VAKHRPNKIVGVEAGKDREEGGNSTKTLVVGTPTLRSGKSSRGRRHS